MSDTDPTAVARANIQKLLSSRGRSSFDLSTELGKNRTYLDDFLKGRKASIASMFSERLAKALNINFSYILGTEELADEEPPPRSSEMEYAQRVKRHLVRIDNEIEKLERARGTKPFDDDELSNAYERQARHRKLVSMAEQRVAATQGHVSGLDQGLFETGWSIAPGYATDVLYSISGYIVVARVPDNSMRDEAGNGFSQGDRVFVDITKVDARNGGIFAVKQGPNQFIRSVEVLEEKTEKKVLCRAMNPLHPAITLTLSDDDKLLGRVVAHIRSL